MKQKHQFKLNLPDDVMGWVTEEAEKNCRSKSAQVVFALRLAKAAAGQGVQSIPAAAE